MRTRPFKTGMLLAVIVAATITGCTNNNDVTRASFAQSTQNAATQPATWMPLAAAAILGATGWDADLSKWASDETPVFGSIEQARDSSDMLQNNLVIGMVASSVLAPVPDDEGLSFRATRVGTNIAAFGGANGVVAGLKESVRRDRPDETDHRSFASGHAVAAFTSASLIDRNLNDIEMSPFARVAVTGTTFGAATLGAWARVEAKKHYPADILASAAISNFMVRSISQPLIGDAGTGEAPISMEISRDGLLVWLSYDF